MSIIWPEHVERFGLPEEYRTVHFAKALSMILETMNELKRELEMPNPVFRVRGCSGDRHPFRS